MSQLQISFPRSLPPMQSLAALKTKLETGRKRAEAAEARLPQLERLTVEKGQKVFELEERLRLTREANTTLKHLVSVLQKLRDAELKLKQRTAIADEAEIRYDTLSAQVDELQARYDGIRREEKELEEMIAELNINI